MRIKQLSVYNFRIHEAESVNLASGTTVITGANGSGKTSLAEAIHIALRGTSFKGTDKDIVRSGSEWYRIEVLFHDDSKRTVTYSVEGVSKKKIIIDDKVHYRLPPAKKLPVVLFEPDHLQLFSGSPSRRRKFIDQMILNIDPSYSRILSRYERSLKQRNTLLKNRVDKDALFAWNVTLSEYGESIIERRMWLIEQLNKDIKSIYRHIADTDDEVLIEYSTDRSSRIREYLLYQLEAKSEQDSILGYTSVGPHRDDIIFRFNHADAKNVASRGEVRSMVIALKFAETHLIKAIHNTDPLVILDDVFGELDKTRRMKLSQEFEDLQVIITSTHEIDSPAIHHITLPAS